ncbi:MAG: hypothetical protein ACMUEL_03130 [Flavobacteriales bacterium Tduv]
MLRSSRKIRFNELYMELSTRKNEFFKRLNTLIHWKMNGERNKKNVSKMLKNKRPTFLQWNIVIYDTAFE